MFCCMFWPKTIRRPYFLHCRIQFNSKECSIKYNISSLKCPIWAILIMVRQTEIENHIPLILLAFLRSVYECSDNGLHHAFSHKLGIMHANDVIGWMRRKFNWLKVLFNAAEARARYVDTLMGEEREINSKIPGKNRHILYWSFD